MKNVSIFLVIITDTNASILSETMRAFTVTLDSKPRNPTQKRGFLQKILPYFKSFVKSLPLENYENVHDVTKRLETNYSFGQFYSEIFDWKDSHMYFCIFIIIKKYCLFLFVFLLVCQLVWPHFKRTLHSDIFYQAFLYAQNQQPAY